MKTLLVARNYLNINFFAIGLILVEVYLHLQILPLQRFVSASNEMVNQFHLSGIVISLLLAAIKKVRFYSLFTSLILLIFYYFLNPLLITVGLRYFLFTLIALIYLSYSKNEEKTENQVRVIDYLFTAFLISHFSSGMLKIFNIDGSWVEGSAILNILESHRSSALFYKPYLHLIPNWTYSIITYFVVIFEVASLFFLFIKKYRALWLKLAILFHFFAFVFLNIADVSFPVLFSLLTLWEIDSELRKRSILKKSF